MPSSFQREARTQLGPACCCAKCKSIRISLTASSTITGRRLMVRAVLCTFARLLMYCSSDPSDAEGRTASKFKFSKDRQRRRTWPPARISPPRFGNLPPPWMAKRARIGLNCWFRSKGTAVFAGVQNQCLTFPAKPGCFRLRWANFSSSPDPPPGCCAHMYPTWSNSRANLPSTASACLNAPLFFANEFGSASRSRDHSCRWTRNAFLASKSPAVSETTPQHHWGDNDA